MAFFVVHANIKQENIVNTTQGESETLLSSQEVRSIHRLANKFAVVLSAFFLGLLLLISGVLCSGLFSAEKAYAEEVDKWVIALDPGHGGSDPGASKNGVVEDVANYAIALECKRVLENSGYVTVFITRGSGEYVRLADRVARAYANNADIIVSLHNNSSTTQYARGCEAWIQIGSSYEKASTHAIANDVAKNVLAQISGSLGLTNRGVYERTCTNGETYPDGSPADYFTVLYEARLVKTPSLIVEHAFLSNPTEAALLKDSAFLKKLGQADAAGILKTYSFANTGVSVSSNAILPGEEFTVTANPLKGSSAGVIYNFAFSKAGSWDYFQSTVKNTGTTTSSTKATFTAPTEPGKYTVWMDVIGSNGIKQTSKSVTIQVLDASELTWECETCSTDKEAIMLGDSITLKADTTGLGARNLNYNYVWRLGDDWSHWSSSVKESGSTTKDTSMIFTPTKEGVYQLWVDVSDDSGTKFTTKSITVDVRTKPYVWSATLTKASNTIVKVGDTVSFSANATGSDSSVLSYNYAVKYGQTWEDFDSTMKRDGKATKETSGSFVAKKPGTYYVWVNVYDPLGREVQTKTLEITVVDGDYAWTATAMQAPTQVEVGDTVTFSVQTKGSDAAELKFNYAWAYGTSGWSEWSSTEKETGQKTSASSASFTPRHAGTYRVWANVVDPSGKTVQVPAAYIEVVDRDYSWNISGVNVSSKGLVGKQIEFSPKVSGADAALLNYNYAWAYGTSGWTEWSSTVKETGSHTANTSATFTPTKTGTYRVWIDAVDPSGKTVTSSKVYITVENSQWKLDGITVPSSGKVGAELSYSAKVSGRDTADLTYNYAWSLNGGWDTWSSTVKEEGKPTANKTGSFKPAQPGVYYLWIDVYDPSGKRLTTETKTVTVSAYEWAASETQVSSEAILMSSTNTSSITVKTNASGTDASKLTYNYCVKYGSDWSNFDSTLKREGKATSTTSYTFTPTKEGLYYLWVNVYDPSGHSVQTNAVCVPVFEKDPTASVTKTQVISSGNVGESISFKTDLPEWMLPYVTINYAWSLGTGWDYWSSTVKETGSACNSSSWTFTPNKAGTYNMWADVTSPFGKTVKVQGASVNLGYPVMGAADTTVEQMVRCYNASGASYPASVYKDYGAADIETFCRILYEEAQAEGVRAEVLFAQVMHETGWLKFGGQIKAEQCNFGGLGAVDGGVGGESFESVRVGLRAQTQHLKAYASKDALVNECVDGRFSYVKRGIAPNVEDFGSGVWASDTQYSTKLLKIINNLKNA